MRRWLLRWPLAIFAVSLVCSADLTVLPTLRTGMLVILTIPTFIRIHAILSLSEVSRFLILYGVSLSASLYTYWFFGWLYNKTIVHDIVDAGIEGGRVAKVGFMERRKREYMGSFRANHDAIKNGNHRIARRIKRWGYPFVSIVGLAPDFLPGLRSGLILTCRVIRWPEGMAAFLVADLVKNLLLTFGWHALFH